MYNRFRRRPDKKNIYKKPENSVLKELEKIPDLSPMLLFLISVAVRDGFVHTTAFSLLKDIYPYVSLTDRQVIENVLGYGNIARKLARDGPFRPLSPPIRKRALTNQEKFSGLLKTLSRYGGQNARRTFMQLEQYMLFRSRVSGLGNKGFSADAIPDLADLFMNNPGAAARSPAYPDPRGPMQGPAALFSALNVFNADAAGGAGHIAGILRAMQHMQGQEQPPALYAPEGAAYADIPPAPDKPEGALHPNHLLDVLQMFGSGSGKGAQKNIDALLNVMHTMQYKKGEDTKPTMDKMDTMMHAFNAMYPQDGQNGNPHMRTMMNMFQNMRGMFGNGTAQTNRGMGGGRPQGPGGMPPQGPGGRPQGPGGRPPQGPGRCPPRRPFCWRFPCMPRWGFPGRRRPPF